MHRTVSGDSCLSTKEVARCEPRISGNRIDAVRNGTQYEDDETAAPRILELAAGHIQNNAERIVDSSQETPCGWKFQQTMYPSRDQATSSCKQNP